MTGIRLEKGNASKENDEKNEFVTLRKECSSRFKIAAD